MYRPVTTGIPAIFAYPRTSGMPRAASVMPANTSAGTRDRSMGSSPRITGSARSHPRQRPPRESGNASPPPRSLRFRIRPSSRRQALLRSEQLRVSGATCFGVGTARGLLTAWMTFRVGYRSPRITSTPLQLSSAEGSEGAADTGAAEYRGLVCTPGWPEGGGPVHPGVCPGAAGRAIRDDDPVIVLENLALDNTKVTGSTGPPWCGHLPPAAQPACPARRQGNSPGRARARGAGCPRPCVPRFRAGHRMTAEPFGCRGCEP